MYGCALREVQTKLEVLNDELSVRYNRNPIEFIKTRVKKPLSIVNKLQRRGLEVSIESMVENLNDVAGIRVICYFLDDIYDVARWLSSQDDIRLLQVKDYIKNPKPNGYRSLHLIVEVPVFFSKGRQMMRVEDVYKRQVEACIKMIERLGGEVVKVIFLMELKGLKGRERLKGYDVASVISYEGN